MSEMSLEELIENVQDAAILGKRDSVFVKGIKNRFAELQQKLDNLKCCGNCKHYTYDMEENMYFCSKYIYTTKQHGGRCTNHYQPDNLTQKERE